MQRNQRRQPIAQKVLFAGCTFALSTTFGFLLPVAAQVTNTAKSERYVVFVRDTRAGHIHVDTTASQTIVTSEVKVNGRGPSTRETIRLDSRGLPTAWTVTGNTAFGARVDNRFSIVDGTATWSEGAGTGTARLAEPSLYVAANASEWAYSLYARALLKDPDRQLPALPGGTLRLEKIAEVDFATAGSSRPLRGIAYAVGGITMHPAYVIMDDDGRLIARASDSTVTIREGLETEAPKLFPLAEAWSADRLSKIARTVGHNLGSRVRIRNARVFDPRTGRLTAPRSIVIEGNTIKAVEASNKLAAPGETAIDAAGASLVPGMYEMHTHVEANSGLVTLMAGVTSVRDMANNNASLVDVSRRIEARELGGPRIIRNGMIEGKSQFSNAGGILAANEAEAVAAVRRYAADGVKQIKIYQSVDPKWVPAMIREADRLGLRVGGHIPAFTTPDAMIEAGYDEISHLNQLVFGWISGPGDDTRTLFRLTGLKRLRDLDLNSAPVQRTIDLIAQHKVAIDATPTVLEQVQLRRNGQIPPDAVAYIDHMPVAMRRSMMQASADVSAPGDDEAYRKSFDKQMELGRLLHQRGVLILPGTDTGGPFAYQRALELMQRFGMSPSQILRRATLEMAQYTGQSARLGSIEPGKLADFFLVAGDPTRDLEALRVISMVVKDGVFYFPAEVYPHFGIKPFADRPTISGFTNAPKPTRR